MTRGNCLSGSFFLFFDANSQEKQQLLSFSCFFFSLFTLFLFMHRIHRPPVNAESNQASYDIWCLTLNRETFLNGCSTNQLLITLLTFFLFLLLHLAVSSCLFLFFQHGLSLGRNVIPFFFLNKRGQMRRKLDPWEVILDREELAVIHTVEHPLGLDVIPLGDQNLLQLKR